MIKCFVLKKSSRRSNTLLWCYFCPRCALVSFNSDPRPSHYKQRRGDIASLRTCANWQELRFMEKILALIAVSLGKKVTVYAVGRVSMRSLFYVIDLDAVGDILCKIYPVARSTSLIVAEVNPVIREVSWTLIITGILSFFLLRCIIFAIADFKFEHG